MPYRAKQRYGSRHSAFRKALAARSARSRSARAAVVAAARRAPRRKAAKRYVISGPRPGNGQQVGLAQFLSHYKPLPKYSKLELALQKHGNIRLNEWRRFQSYERVHTQPDSGRAMWLGVPDKLMQGTTVAEPTTDSDYTPANCDLYDISRKMLQTYKDKAAGAGYVNPYSDIAGLAADTLWQPIGDQPNANTGTTQQVGTLANVRGLQVKNHWCEVLMENVSSIDAFVEQYVLEYRRPMAVGVPFSAMDSTIIINHTSYGGDFIGGWDRAAGAPSAMTASNNNEPRLFYPARQYPATPMFNPYAGGAIDTRQYGVRMAACSLEQYARTCINHRIQQSYATPYQKVTAALADEITATIGYVSPEALFCNPMTDPKQAWPRSVKNTHGYRLVKIKKAICLKPGQSMRVKIPTKDSFYQDFADFPRVADREMDRAWVSRGVSQLTLNVSQRDAQSIPNRQRFHFFRVFGDMTSDKSALESNGDVDFQTGSCRVQFMIRRSLDCRLAQFERPKEVDPVFALDTSVAIANQEAINDEADAPAGVQVAGD